MGEQINFYGSLLALAGCVFFVAVYSVMAPWWRGRIGRMLVTKAVAIAGLMLISVVYHLADIDVEWIRLIRGVFCSVIGVMMIFQTRLVYRFQQNGKSDKS